VFLCTGNNVWDCVYILPQSLYRQHDCLILQCCVALFYICIINANLSFMSKLGTANFCFRPLQMSHKRYVQLRHTKLWHRTKWIFNHLLNSLQSDRMNTFYILHMHELHFMWTHLKYVRFDTSLKYVRMAALKQMYDGQVEGEMYQ
jgi:hypothetical protein